MARHLPFWNAYSSASSAKLLYAKHTVSGSESDAVSHNNPPICPDTKFGTLSLAETLVIPPNRVACALGRQMHSAGRMDQSVYPNRNLRPQARFVYVSYLTGPLHVLQTARRLRTFLFPIQRHTEHEMM